MTDTEPEHTRSFHPVFVGSGLGLALFILVCDQLSKWWVREIVLGDISHMEIFPFFNLVHVWNTGISFGLFGGGDAVSVAVLTVLAMIITGFFLVLLCQSIQFWPSLACGLVIGGSIGNIIDRIRFGAVYDFLDVIIITYHWPAFNIADSAIVVGITILAIYYLIHGKEA